MYVFWCRQWLLLIEIKIRIIISSYPNLTTSSSPAPAPDSCDAFFDSPSVRDFRYARNQIQKAERSQKGIASLDKLFGKAATAFHDAATFFKDCSDPRALPLYEGLRFDQIKRENISI